MKNNNYEEFDLVKYSIYTDKLKLGEKVQVVLIADLHNYLINKKKALLLANAIKDRKPHHIVIAGDIIQGRKWENKKILSSISNFLNNLSEVAPVFIIRGNHDLVGINNKRNDYFKSLEVKNKVYALDNDLVTYDNFDIVGFNPSKEIYDLGLQQHGLAHDRFIKEFMNKGVKLKKSKNITEFVGHSPYLFAKSENGIGLEDLKYVDTIYTGHMHNGYYRSSTTKNNPDKYLDYGYVERSYSFNKYGKLCSFNPLFFSKTDLCRGVIYIDDNSKKRILQLRNNHFYIYDNTWDNIDEKDARKLIKDNNYHPMVITGGIRKFFGFNLPNDKPEITEITYEGK